MNALGSGDPLRAAQRTNPGVMTDEIQVEQGKGRLAERVLRMVQRWSRRMNPAEKAGEAGEADTLELLSQNHTRRADGRTLARAHPVAMRGVDDRCRRLKAVSGDPGYWPRRTIFAKALNATEGHEERVQRSYRLNGALKGRGRCFRGQYRALPTRMVADTIVRGRAQYCRTLSGRSVLLHVRETFFFVSTPPASLQMPRDHTNPSAQDATRSPRLHTRPCHDARSRRSEGLPGSIVPAVSILHPDPRLDRSPGRCQLKISRTSCIGGSIIAPL